MNNIVQDAFTARLLIVYKQLIIKQAFVKKKEFTDAIQMKATTFNSLERLERNFPQSAEQRRACINGLYEFGVNAMFLDGKTDVMFWKEPVKKKKATSLAAVEMNFRDKNVKSELLQQLNDLQKENAELRKEVAYYRQLNIAAEPYEKYLQSSSSKNNSDNNSDKSTPKAPKNASTKK